MFSSSPVSPEPQFRSGENQPIVIGLVNNMPDAALRTTERQFCALLSVASGNIQVCLRLFYLPELPRQDWGRSFVNQCYENISELWATHIDGLIVTGTEPAAAALVDEPYWQTLTKLVDWAEDHTVSTIWSCLAAHAAVLHIDGIDRCALGGKLSGIFECTKAADHSLMARAPSRWRVPHSRYNEVPEKALVSKGYRILSRSADAGADMFVKHRRSLFIFFQGHPEYDPGALLREYRRDSRKFLVGERTNYPEMPRNYFDNDTGTVLAEFRERALRNPSIDLLSSFPAVANEKLAHVWRELSMATYTNWLSYLVEQRARNPSPTEIGCLHDGEYGLKSNAKSTSARVSNVTGSVQSVRGEGGVANEMFSFPRILSVRRGRCSI
jgi:homoserine O-succinyltransferase